MDDPVAVALEVVARPTDSPALFLVEAAAASFRRARPGRNRCHAVAL